MKTRPLSPLQLDLLRFLFETEKAGRPAPWDWTWMEFDGRTVASLEDRGLIEGYKGAGRFFWIRVTTLGKRALLEGRSPLPSQLQARD